ncbi:ribulose-phosphate 3-epimerase [Alicyclobacillaceae bacterium I2511]|nr:ribulose-phosphate 3-epimerase [Alicyclobacillaceae bacterium I2511]
MKIQIAPSILAADFIHLQSEVDSVLAAGADWIHVDVMDGHFVPNLTMGPIVVEALRARTDCPLDVHLMVERPEQMIPWFAQAGATSISVHAEATPHLHRALQLIRSYGLQAGMAVNPATGLTSLDYIYDQLDYLLIMTVNPGFGGQSMISATLKKVRSANERLAQLGRTDVPVEVDGGVSVHTIGDLAAAGARIFVAGSAVFQAQDRRQAIAALRAAAQQTSGSRNA